MSENTHTLAWFELPVSDIARAKTFYSTILGVELATMDLGDGFKMEVFPGESGSVSGALVWHPEGWYAPSNTHGPLIYFDADPDLQLALDKVEAAGGSVSIPKRQISEDHGYMAVIEDTEGNRVALWSKS